MSLAALFALHSEAHVLRHWDSSPWTDPDRAHAFIARSRARVLEKLGFQREGTLREDCVVDGVVSDSWAFGLLRRSSGPDRPLTGAEAPPPDGGGASRHVCAVAQTPRPPRTRPRMNSTSAMMARTIRMVHNMVTLRSVGWC